MRRHNRRVALFREEPYMPPAKVLFRCRPELKDLLERTARQQGLAGGVNELVLQVLGDFFERPDLRTIQRRKPGPKGPRKKLAV
jgi:hypothetical protein